MVNGFASGKKPEITEAQRASFITKAEHIRGTLAADPTPVSIGRFLANRLWTFSDRG